MNATVAWVTYPGLTREPFAAQALAWRRQPAIHLLHSTEGNGYPSRTVYRDGRSAPHFTVDMRARTAHQHFPLTGGAWALVAPSGIATNTGGAIQYELVGTCAGVRGMYDVTRATDEELAYLAGLLAEVSKATGIPMACTVPFRKYPASYGASPVRMTAAQWGTYRGIAGHQHVPGNVHGDPGDFPIQRLITLAPTQHTATMEDDDDMPSAQEIATAVWQTPVFDKPDGTKLTAWQALRDAYTASQQGVGQNAENNRLLGVLTGWQQPKPGTPEVEGMKTLTEPDPEPIAQAVVDRLPDA